MPAIIGFILLLLSPLLSIPYILNGIYLRRKGFFLLFSLLLGIFAFISFPSYDLYRHFCEYNRLSTLPISSISWIDTSLNGILPYIYWLMAHIGIPFGFLRFVELFIGFYLLTIVFRHMTEGSVKQHTHKERFVRFGILFFFFDFLYTTMGVKYGFALCIFIYSIHQFINLSNRKTGILCFIIACLWHSSFVFTGLVIFFIYRLNPNKKTALITCGILAIIIPLLIALIGPYLFDRRFDFYFSKRADNTTSYSAMSTIGLVLYLLAKSTVIPLAYIVIKHYDKQTKWCRIALGWLILSVILISNSVTFYRFWWAFMAVSVFAFFELESKISFSRSTLAILICSGMLFTCLNVITYHKEVLNSTYYRAIYPAPLVLSSDYQKQQVFYLLRTDGDFK